MKQVVLIQTILLCILVATPEQVFAMSWTQQVANEGRPVHENTAEWREWPNGVLEFLNDPARKNGWNPCFSEWPNDRYQYEIELRDKEDVARVISKFSDIDYDDIQILLHPGPEPRGLGFTTGLPEGNGLGATFGIGCQRVINEWFPHLPKNESGERVFGVNRYTEPPTALPPTLKLYVENPAVNLDELKIPLSVNVKTSVSDHYRKEHKDDPVVEAIDKFVDAHEAKQEKVLADEAAGEDNA